MTTNQPGTAILVRVVRLFFCLLLLTAGCGKAAYDQRMESQIQSMRTTAVAEQTEEDAEQAAAAETQQAENAAEEELDEDELEDLRLEREAEEAEEAKARELEQRNQRRSTPPAEEEE